MSKGEIKTQEPRMDFWAFMNPSSGVQKYLCTCIFLGRKSTIFIFVFPKESRNLPILRITAVSREGTILLLPEPGQVAGWEPCSCYGRAPAGQISRSHLWENHFCQSVRTSAANSVPLGPGGAGWRAFSLSRWSLSLRTSGSAPTHHLTST